MNRLTFLFLTLSLLASAVPVITGGAITAGSSAAGGPSLNVSLTGPGLNVFYADNRHSFSLPPSCTAAPCNFDFTQSVVIGIASANVLVDGTQYNLVSGTLSGGERSGTGYIAPARRGVGSRSGTHLFA